MTEFEKVSKMKTLMNIDGAFDDEVLTAFLQQAKAKILTRRYPFGIDGKVIEPCYEHLQIELAVVLYSQSGAEGQSTHNENGVSRTWRSVDEILNEITPMAGNI